MATKAKPEIETVRYTRMRVAVIKGPDAGRVVERAGETIVVGTHEDASLRLSDETVSRQHCEIALNERGFRVRDLGSTNGLLMNKVRVFDIASNVPLAVELGETVIAITPQPDDEPRERTSVGRFGPLLGQAPRMRELFALLARVAPSELPVLIEGETGTGKELVAQSIHEASARSEGSFVIFDCSTASANLIESDLFGHERGAFTGAQAARVGALEEADGGTLFLDEIGELPLELQQRLLRCLQSGEYRRVGGRRLDKTDIRVIAATNRNLRADVQAGRFREDLYYRLEGVLVHVPPLRERVQDIPMLVEHFLRRDTRGRTPAALPPHALAMLQGHRWPGNVRELANVVRRLQVLPDLALGFAAVGGQSAPTSARPDAPPTSELGRLAERLSCWRSAPGESAPALEDTRRAVQDAFERDYLSMLKDVAGTNKTAAAAISGVTRQAIQKLVRKHGFPWELD